MFEDGGLDETVGMKRLLYFSVNAEQGHCSFECLQVGKQCPWVSLRATGRPVMEGGGGGKGDMRERERVKQLIKRNVVGESEEKEKERQKSQVHAWSPWMAGGGVPERGP